MPTYLYLEPSIYVPYKLSLRRKNAIVIDAFECLQKGNLYLDTYRPKRMPNQNYLYFSSVSVPKMDVTHLVGKDKILTFDLTFLIRHDPSGSVVQVRHRQHVSFAKPGNQSPDLCHYNLRHCCPAIYGLEGKKVIDAGGLPSGRCEFRDIMQFGLDGETHEGRKWLIETHDIVSPLEVQKQIDDGNPMTGATVTH